MTVPVNDRRIQYTATASQTVFPYDFKITANTEITVLQTIYLTGVTNTLTLTTEYTVSDVGEAAGGNITLVTGAAVDDTVTITGATPLSRVTDFNQAGDFLMSDLNDQLDKITDILQENETETNRALLLAPEDSANSLTLPVTADRIGNFLTFDSNGDPTVSAGSADTVTVSPFMATVLDDTTAAEARTTLVAQEDVVTTRGDIVRGSSSAVAERLAIGSASTFLKSDGTDPSWSTITEGINNNLIINGQGLIAQRGTSFTSATTPANSDDTYLLDRMLLVSDGNDIVDVSQETTTVPTGSYSAIKFDVETANKQFGYVQILEAKDAAAIIGGTASLSFKARKGGSNATLETLRAAIISWDSTADTVTSDVVGTWAGAGTDPTLATNWTYENTPSDLTLTTSYQTFSIENISIDTTSTTNVAVFIWCDDTDATVADLAYITDIKLEEGSVSTDFITRPYQQELALCQRFYFEELNPNIAAEGNAVGASNGVCYAEIYFPVTMRVNPSLTSPTFSTSNISGSVGIPQLSKNGVLYNAAANLAGRFFFSDNGSTSLKSDSEL
jgi:hypothetical protein